MYEFIKWHWNNNRNTDVYTCEINIADTLCCSLDTYSLGWPYDTTVKLIGRELAHRARAADARGIS